MKWQKHFALMLVVLSLSLGMTGCRYSSNRYYDFRDTFSLGAGVTAENAVTGIVPPSIGAHVQVTEFAQLGWITHNGYTAELDLRGTFVGPEKYTHAGFLWWQTLKKSQSYEDAFYYNKFKDGDFEWCTRMESYLLSSYGRSAKELHFDYWSPYAFEGTWLFPKGWRYWGYSGVNVAICEPFLTHMGVMLNAGVDPSEFSDFVLGIFGIDFKHDDMLPEEHAAFRGHKPTSAAPLVAPTVSEVPQAPIQVVAPAPDPTPAPMVEETMPVAVPAPEFKVIYFDYDKSDVRADQVGRMNDNLKILDDENGLKVEIIGHTDERGTDNYNQSLGMKRANAVKAWLVGKGIAGNRLQVTSRGKAEPVVPGEGEPAWQQNRRAVLVRILAN